MGKYTSGYINIYCESEEDANNVFKEIANIVSLTEKRTGSPCHFNLFDNEVDGDLFRCNVSSSRVINGEFQVNQVIKQLKLMISEKRICPPIEFNAELTVSHESWSLSDEDFNLDI
jgi:hypothetical protein